LFQLCHFDCMEKTMGPFILQRDLLYVAASPDDARDLAMSGMNECPNIDGLPFADECPLIESVPMYRSARGPKSNLVTRMPLAGKSPLNQYVAIGVNVCIHQHSNPARA